MKFILQLQNQPKIRFIKLCKGNFFINFFTIRKFIKKFWQKNFSSLSMNHYKMQSFNTLFDLVERVYRFLFRGKRYESGKDHLVSHFSQAAL